MKRGIFITFEGTDGTGKTTQFRLLVRHLRRRGYKVLTTHEPGGTSVGRHIRRILLSGRAQGPSSPAKRKGETSLAPTALVELALMYADRAQDVEEVIRPALARGEIVISDRYNDSSFAYQGYGRGLGAATVQALDKIICGKTQPDLTLVLDVEPRQALGRARRRERRRRSARGRFEAQGLRFHKRVREGYLTLARREPRRVKIIRADRTIDETQSEIRQWVDEFLARRIKASSKTTAGRG